MDGKAVEQTPRERHGNRQQKEIGEEVNEVARPLLDINCITEPSCDYPVAVKILMDDGTVQTYALENKMDLQFQKVMQCLDRIKIGYQYKPKKRRNRIHRCDR